MSHAESDLSRKDAKMRRGQGNGSSCGLKYGVVLPGRAYERSEASNCDSNGAWNLARTAGQEPHTTGGPHHRRLASGEEEVGGRKWEVVLLFSGLASIDGSESVSDSFANGRRG